MKSIRYPDGELVKYNYGRQGELQSIKGDNNQYTYAQGLQYDKLENLIVSVAGNGVEEKFMYDPQRKYLTASDIKNAALTLTFSKDYTYDNANNITHVNGSNSYALGTGTPLIRNDASAHQYDNLNRLIVSFNSQGNGASNSLRMAYTPAGNIKTKEQLVSAPATNSRFNSKEYTYSTSQPHVPEMIEDHATGALDMHITDSNGNIEVSVTNEYHERRFDEQNQLLSILSEIGYGNTLARQQYTYDAGGERAIKYRMNEQKIKINNYTYVKKLVVDDYTLYVNPYMTVKDGMYTKHIYNNGRRLASRIANRNFARENDPSVTLADDWVMYHFGGFWLSI